MCTGIVAFLHTTQENAILHVSAGKGKIFQNICVESIKFALVGMAKQIISSKGG